MKYEDIKRVLEEEKKPTISKIFPDFYRQVQKYIQEMENADQKISRRHSEEAIMIQYELKNALSAVDKIFNRRTRKIIKMASGKAFSKNPSNIAHDTDNMTPEEKDIYFQVLEAILSGKKNTIEPILGIDSESIATAREHSVEQEVSQIGETDIEPPSTNIVEDQALILQGEEAAAIPESELQSASEDEKISVSDENGKKDLNKECIVVRILKDVPTFIGTDGRNYTLSSQDVAVLPKVNANALVKRKVAIPINSS